MSLEPTEMAALIGAGLLSFPVTHFDDRLAFDEHGFRAHCARLVQQDIAGLFAAGGTGEFFSLTPEEVEAVARAAVAEVRGRVPVIAGCRYGTALAFELAAQERPAGISKGFTASRSASVLTG